VITVEMIRTFIDNIPRLGHYPLGHHVTGISCQTVRPSSTEEQRKVRKIRQKIELVTGISTLQILNFRASMGSFDSPERLDVPFLKAESMFRNREKSFLRAIRG